MRTLVTLLSAFLLVGASAGSASARDVFKTEIVGKQVAFQEIAGISPDLAQPWKVAAGAVKIQPNGSLKAEMSGLLLLNDTVGPVVTVFASLVCQKTAAVGAGVPTNEVVASTADVPLSAAGDALIRETITLPAVCVAPIVLIRIELVQFGGPPFPITNLGIPQPWIAASGF